eukprot:scaffold109995_cov20-Prasinocladus_malaysianus.AAC.1
MFTGRRCTLQRIGRTDTADHAIHHPSLISGRDSTMPKYIYERVTVGHRCVGKLRKQIASPSCNCVLGPK